MKVQFLFDKGPNEEFLNIYDCCFELDIIPRKGDEVDLLSFLNHEQLSKINNTEVSSEHAEINLVRLTKDDDGFYYEIWIKCYS